MQCTKVQEEFSAFLDDALETEIRETVEEHIFDCSNCLRDLDKLKGVDREVRQISVDELSDDFDSEVQRVFDSTKRYHSGATWRSSLWLLSAIVILAATTIALLASFIVSH